MSDFKEQMAQRVARCLRSNFPTRPNGNMYPRRPEQIAELVLQALTPADWAEGAVSSGGMVEAAVRSFKVKDGDVSFGERVVLYRVAGEGEGR